MEERTLHFSVVSMYGLDGLKEGGGGGGGGGEYHNYVSLVKNDFLNTGSMADILGQFFGGGGGGGGGDPFGGFGGFGGLFGGSMGGGGRTRRRKGEDVGHPLK